MIFFTKRKQGLHDIIAKTVVLKDTKLNKEVIKQEIKISDKIKKQNNNSKKNETSRVLLIVLIFVIVFSFIVISIYLTKKASVITSDLNKTLEIVDYDSINFNEPLQKVPFAGCDWELLISKELKLGLWTQVCSENSMVPELEYFAKDDSLIEKTTRKGKVYEDAIIQIFNKDAEQSIEEFINENFKQGMIKFAFDNCNVEKVEIKPSKFISGLDFRKYLTKIEKYEIIPSDELIEESKKVNPEGPASWGGLCGDYGLTNVSRYFQYNPEEDPTRVLFIYEGQDVPFFDADTIKLFKL